MLRLLAVGVILGLSGWGWWSPAVAKEFLFTRDSSVLVKPKTGWGSEIRSSASLFTGDLGQDTRKDSGPLANGMVLYTFDPFWKLGIMSEWTRHQVPSSGLDIGKAKTFSILPILEFHYRAGLLSPYINFGAGINFNTFDDDQNVATLCGVLGIGACDFSPEDTIAARVGVGADFFISDQLAVNIESAWTRNSADLSLKVAGATAATRNFDGDSVEALIGFRYYFSPCAQC